MPDEINASATNKSVCMGPPLRENSILNSLFYLVLSTGEISNKSGLKSMFFYGRVFEGDFIKF